MEAPDSYGERQVIIASKEDASLFEAACKKMGEKAHLQKENQCLLDATLYTIYHQYGGKLDDTALDYFFTKENVDIARLIFKWEFVDDKREATDLQMALFASSPVLTKEWLRLNAKTYIA